ncbi:hypothetical protein SAY87_027480 [Trapa incisa]|uniref:C2H2-type domain-containing protein n=1 Tax=Trapa incisa TaxID=236973 RepID=A0AAN7GRU3_9MYRT|nr:hypothetical protein SAY87_027480 [Trapa incisa]
MLTVCGSTLGPEPETRRLVDMSKLTQSELQTLSLRSSSSSLGRRAGSSDYFFLPKIDRSIFNESAGSRRQTYSLPDSGFSSSSAVAAAGHHHRNRVAGQFPIHKVPSIALDDDPENRENRAIIRILKHYISLNPSPSFAHIDLIPPSLLAPVGITSDHFESFGGNRKRKRSRKPRAKMNLNAEHRNELEPLGTSDMKNKNGVEVDIDALADLEDPYAEEFRKRTEGLQSEEELLSFLRDLGGEWGSRRKRRKIVDAGIFGDFLPVGWKLLLGLRRREGHASIYCRRYVSPSGQQFISCKEISSYFRSCLGLKGASQLPIQGKNYVKHDCNMDITHQHTGRSVKDERHSVDIVSCPPAPAHSLRKQSTVDKEASLLNPENLPQDQVNDLFECHKCNTTFSEKDSYLQHLVSFHQRTMKRYRIGSSVGDGVIMKDGKFECQFCHKVFEERRRYNGHVGIHVRNYVRRKEESSEYGSALNKMEPSSGSEVPSRISKMDALIEIAQSSILETTSGIRPNCGPNESTACFTSKSNLDNNLKADASVSDVKMEMTDSEQTLDEELTDSEDEYAIIDVKGKLKEDYDHTSDVNMNLECEKILIASTNEQNGNTIGTNTEDCRMFTVLDIPRTQAVKDSSSSFVVMNENLGSAGPNENVNNNDNMLEMTDLTIGHAELDADVKQTIQQNTDSNIQVMNENLGSTCPNENVNNDDNMLEMTDLTMGHAELDTDVMRTIQGENDFCSIERKDNLAPLEGIRYDEIETPLEFQFVMMEEKAQPMPEEHLDLRTNLSIEERYDLSAALVSEERTLNLMKTVHQLTSSCVWCGVEFNHEATDSNIQSDSVGFMCPNCKVKISGQLNAFGSNLPMDSNCL